MRGGGEEEGECEGGSEEEGVGEEKVEEARREMAREELRRREEARELLTHRHRQVVADEELLYVPEVQGWAGAPSRIRRPENSEEHCSDPVSLRKKPIFACDFCLPVGSKMKFPTPCVMYVGPRYVCHRPPLSSYPEKSAFSRASGAPASHTRSTLGTHTAQGAHRAHYEQLCVCAIKNSTLLQDNDGRCTDSRNYCGIRSATMSHSVAAVAAAVTASRNYFSSRSSH